MYLVKRRRKWWARHDLPEDLKAYFGASRLQEGLDTEDRKVAEKRAAILWVQWQNEMEKARKGSVDHIEQDAQFWRRRLLDAGSEAEKELIHDLIADEAERKFHAPAIRAGVKDDRDPRFDDLAAAEEAQRFFDVATGRAVKLDEHLDEWLATLNNEAKSKDMKKSSIRKFAEEFPLVADVKRKDVQRWVNRQVEAGKAVATIRRSLSELRGYWVYLTALEVVSENDLPFERLNLPKPSKRDAVLKERRHFEPADVVKLVNAAEERGDTQLADLIRLGMWTGARLEELCALRVDRVGDGFFSVEDAKTPAGWRKVPIHSKLAPTMARLLEVSQKAKDEYVLAGLSLNKYGDRSNAIGKRFGRLKTDLGFGEAHVFHSIRHTVAHQFKNARVEEAIAADILGHEHERITFGTYASEQARLSDEQIYSSHRRRSAIFGKRQRGWKTWVEAPSSNPLRR
ncbi:tyrosine-type recombinase/integrase [Paramagnetospirillum magneticum]|uniref:Integrase n=1 Tax=Paramagnetospirillum magneticum (strain ATCC 700264 / AMB-1) TaxID=342108 RepID=Q2W2G6_PARM1|nr:tyrosine-type recombinase/integrase [Paramagnetospirillum magneticum]BAE51959.1 Integrase [Paramagnetospirillum magneticum AMB-1]